MKTLLAIEVVLFSAAFAQTAHADVVTVGTADEVNCSPFMCNGSSSSTSPTNEYQQVYSSTAFSGPINIASETFYSVFAQMFGGSDLLLGGTYVFSLSTTHAMVNALSPDLATNLGSNNTQVLEITVPTGGVSFGSAFTFTNQKPFSYDPTQGNLLLDIKISNQDNVPNYSGNSYLDADDTGMVTSRAYASSVFNSADSVGLVTTFNTPEPRTLWPLAGLLGLGLLRRRLFS